MRIEFGKLLSIETAGHVKARGAVPAGTVATDRSDAARAMSQNMDAMQATPNAQPAMGTRPDPGARAIEMPGAHDSLDPKKSPLRWNIPYAYNVNYTPRRMARTPFQTLRAMADIDDVIRICIETRKDQMCSLQWDITTRELDGKKGKTLEGSVKKRIDAAKAFFQKPDKRRSFYTWLRAAIEDVLVIDALAIYRRRQNNGKLYALELKDGATFVCQIDETGDTPAPPEIAYRQVIWGNYLTGGDCTVEDLLYRPRCVRNNTPYGLSPTEAVLLAVNTAIQRQLFDLAYYTDGSIPEGIIDAPENFTPEQMIEAEGYLNDMLAGNLGARRRLRMVPKGSATTMKQFKEHEFVGGFYEWLLKVRCAAFAVPPSEVGFTADVNKATSKGQENIVYRRGVKPLSAYFSDIFDQILAEDFQSPDLRFAWSGGEAEDKLSQARTDDFYVKMGKTSIDELRQRDGDDPIGLGNYISTAAGPVLVSDLLNPDLEDDDPTTSASAAGAAPGGKAGQGAGAGTPTKAGDTEGEGAAIKGELAKWRAAAIKRVKKGTEQKRWASTLIPEAFVGELHGALEKVVTVAEVVALFDAALAGVDKARKTSKAIKAIEKKMHGVAARHFLTMGDAVVEHLAPAVERLPKEEAHA